MSESRIKDIYDILHDNGIDVYFPTQHEGECISPYTVVKSTGTSQQGDNSFIQATYDLMCYVPKEQYSLLDVYVQQVKTIMKKLRPMIQSTHFQTPSYYDADVKGHMISMSYLNYRKFYKNS